MESVFPVSPPISGRHYRRGETVYRGEKESGFHGLRQKFHPSAFYRTASAFFVRDEASEKENWNIAESRIQRSLPREIAASFAWHIDIEQHDVRLELQRSREGAKGFINDHHFVLARIFQDHAGEARKVLVIVHDQNAPLAHASLGARLMR
jgi:hypothetical protein